MNEVKKILSQSIGLDNMILFGKKYECSICGAKFKTEKELLDDMEKHKQGIFRCEACNEDFADEGSMKIHRARDHRI